MKTITYLRHGESTGNAAGVIQGRGSSPLSERGRMQAAAVGERLEGHEYHLVVSSDMERALETTELLDRPFVSDSAWQEMDVGGWDGLTNREISEQYADELQALRRGEDVPLGGGGERISQLVERVDAAQAGLFERMDEGQSALVVCHGGVIETIVGLMLRIGDAHRLVARVTNTALTTVTRTEHGTRLARFNDAAHLGAVTGWAGGLLRRTGVVLGLVRHGRTDANASGRWQGQTDNGLNDLGRRQATDLAAWYGNFEELYTSPLGRAAETASILADGSEPHPHSDLIELGMGEWEGRTRQEIEAGWPDLWARIYKHDEDLPRGETGETWAGLQERVTRAVGEIIDGRHHSHVGVVSHGAAIRSYVCGILGLDHTARLRLGVPANTSVSHVVFEDGRCVLADYNVAPHLD
jgi:broad specificity phosphatase PhoE